MIWLDTAAAEALAREGTDAYRIATGPGCRIERFGDGIIVSHAAADGFPSAVAELERWLEAANVRVSAWYERKLVTAPGRDDAPRRFRGAGSTSGLARENGLLFEIDFLAGYSCGLFPDQRSNRKKLRELAPKRMLNTFAYTCAFSVAAAAAGAQTLSLDVSKGSLERGRRNFGHNGLPLDGHRFIADDVFDVLPRLARRDERFDLIVLDPPTFSRGRKGRVFRAETGYGRLMELAAACLAPGGWILLSTNCSSLDSGALRQLALEHLPGSLEFAAPPPQPDVPVGGGSSTVWVRMRPPGGACRQA